MAADTTTLTEKMRAALRISSTSEKITEEINDCIAACKADMKNDGVKVIKETDGLIIRAITLYCKAEFGFNNAAEQFRKSYDALKMRLRYREREAWRKTPYQITTLFKYHKEYNPHIFRQEQAGTPAATENMDDIDIALGGF